MAVVVDTNIPVIASIPAGSRADGQPTDLDCIQACVGQIRAIQNGIVVCLDDGWLILREYQRQPSLRSLQVVGGQFLRWLLQRRADPNFCELVRITPRGASGRVFEEFPDVPELATFDPSDQKFVAVALASQLKPTIVYAADRGWERHRESLVTNGVKTQSICRVLDR